MEPTGQEEERKAEELLVVLPHSRHKGSWGEIERMAQDPRHWRRK